MTRSLLTASSVDYSIGETQILHGVDIDVHEGEMLGVVGPNGSGKSTLLRILGGLIRPAAGTLTFSGRPMKSYSRKELARQLALVEQRAQVNTELTVRDVIGLGRIPYTSALGGLREKDHRIVEQVARETGVEEFLDRIFTRLSGGEQQRVHIARALAQQTPVLFLDEPTNHLDISYQLLLMDLVADTDLTTVVVLHDLNLAAMYCDRVVVMEQGTIRATGTPAEVLTPALITDVFSVSSMVHDPGTGSPLIQYLREMGRR